MRQSNSLLALWRGTPLSVFNQSDMRWFGENKEKQELNVFRQFARECPLPLDAETARTVDPPAPDIECQLDDGTWLAFELVEVVAEKEARQIHQHIRNRRTTPLLGTFGQTPEAVMAIREKLTAKTYVTSHPAELLAWCGVGGHTEVPSHVIDSVKEDVRQSPVFRRVWLFHAPRGGRGIMGYWPLLDEADTR